MECAEQQNKQPPQIGDHAAAICLAKMVEAINRNPPGTIIGSAQWQCCLDFAGYVLASVRGSTEHPTPQTIVQGELPI